MWSYVGHLFRELPYLIRCSWVYQVEIWRIYFVMWPYMNSSLRFMFLAVCHVIYREYMFKGLCEFMGGNPLLWVTILPSLMTIGFVQVVLQSI